MSVRGCIVILGLTTSCAETELLMLDPPPPEPCAAASVRRVAMTATFVPTADAVAILGGFRAMRLQNGPDVAFPREVEMIAAASASSTVIGSMPAGMERAEHTATLLADDRILVSGGWTYVEGARRSTATSLVIDARDSAGVRVDAVDLRLGAARHGHQAVRLLDGRVLVVGGRDAGPDGSTFVEAIEVYDPTSQSFTTTDRLVGGRYGHAATRRGDGTVLVTGGYDADGPRRDAVVIRDGRVVSTTDLPAEVGPVFHAAVWDGSNVLIAGGAFDVAGQDVSDAVVALSREDVQRMANPRARHTLTPLGDDFVVVGGLTETEVLGTAEWLFADPRRSLGLCEGPRLNHAAAATPDGVVVFGGSAGGDPAEGALERFEVLRE